MLKKLQPKPGVNRENTRYTSENGWYDCDKIRFRQGTPEKIGGWLRISLTTFKGVCTSLWSWVTLGSQKLTGVGTNLKFYVERGGAYADVTPVKSQITLTDPFTTTSGSTTVVVTDATSSYTTGSYVSFYNGTTVGGLDLVGEYVMTVTSNTTYTIEASSAATSSATGGGTVYALYQIDTGPSHVTPVMGWGTGAWGAGAWGVGEESTDTIRLWGQSNFGEDLVFGPRGGGLYYLDVTNGLTAQVFTATVASPTVITTYTAYVDGTPIRFVPDTGSTLPVGIIPGLQYYVRNASGLTFNVSTTPTGALLAVTGAGTGSYRVMATSYNIADFGGATDVPSKQNTLLVSDISRFVFAFGCTDYGSTTIDPMLVRWSAQEDPYNWTPSATNQAGSLPLSKGSEIVTAKQARQEILVWTDSALYSMQYVGPPYVWGAQLVGDNISIASPRAVAYANGTAYWMGVDKFYKYDGSVKPLRCDLRQFIFTNINTLQFDQVFSGTNEGFNEVWWFYCNGNSDTTNRYVIYNYVEDCWYYGTMDRSAWLDSGINDYPLAATYSNNIVNHEYGVDDYEGGSAQPINAYITSAEFDLDDGHNFMFIWRMLPDITFRGSTATNPSVMMTLYPLKNSGSGYTDPASVGGVNYAGVTRAVSGPVEEFTGQVYTRARGRQLAIKVESSTLGVAWQLGSPRLDMRPDGRR